MTPPLIPARVDSLQDNVNDSPVREPKLALVWDADVGQRMNPVRWKAAFFALAIDLCPDCNPDAVDEASDTAFGDGLSPEAAALQWAARQGPVPPSHLRWFDE